MLLVASAAFVALTPIGRYLARAAWEEGKILARRAPIATLIADGDGHADRVTRDKLRLVLAARSFAVDSIGLEAGQSFATYSQLERDTLVLVLSAAPRDRLEHHTWWFPIVGRVPYKGFFDFGAAHDAARALEADGLDTHLRPASAFSTLGWFNDPLLSTTVRLDPVDLANTVIHELTHNTFYAQGQAIFNESFANFVGARGAEWFFRSRGDSAAAARTDAWWEDEKLLGRFTEDVYKSLDSAFAAHAESKEARMAARTVIYERARRVLEREIAPRLRTIAPQTVARMRLNNAALLARRIYRTGLELFDQVYLREGRDLRRAMQRIIALAELRPDDPYGALREWVMSAPAEAPA